MGIDYFDIKHRIAKRFSIELGKDFDSALSKIAADRKQQDFTASEIYEVMLLEIQRQRRTVPEESWKLFCECVAEGLGLDINQVQPDSWMVAELGMS